jgi:hypothetical protein
LLLLLGGGRSGGGIGRVELKRGELGEGNREVEDGEMDKEFNGPRAAHATLLALLFKVELVRGELVKPGDGAEIATSEAFLSLLKTTELGVCLVGWFHLGVSMIVAVEWEALLAAFKAEVVGEKAKRGGSSGLQRAVILGVPQGEIERCGRLEVMHAHAKAKGFVPAK